MFGDKTGDIPDVEGPLFMTGQRPCKQGDVPGKKEQPLEHRHHTDKDGKYEPCHVGETDGGTDIAGKSAMRLPVSSSCSRKEQDPEVQLVWPGTVLRFAFTTQA